MSFFHVYFNNYFSVYFDISFNATLRPLDCFFSNVCFYLTLPFRLFLSFPLSMSVSVCFCHFLIVCFYLFSSVSGCITLSICLSQSLPILVYLFFVLHIYIWKLFNIDIYAQCMQTQLFANVCDSVCIYIRHKIAKSLNKTYLIIEKI